MYEGGVTFINTEHKLVDRVRISIESFYIQFIQMLL